ncbi:unnamed protein product [Dibothriocephalus latus]|uniref:Uncharacterized protein n=1 Tax=Dibothriocephalus latus TaxID=60516 RepID=A0A3P7NTE3_DIBLA|nr:unnamed protein product [Dibothriocephalus latus]
MVPADQTDESSALLSARLLAFTPDSTGLISLVTGTQQIAYLDLQTGCERWSFTPSADSSLCAPRPVAVALRTPTVPTSSCPVRLDLRLSILYTNSQLVEWQVPISVEPCSESGTGKFKVSVKEHPVQDPWLLEFWASVGKEWNRRLPPFHSMDYLGPSGDCWILVSAGFVVYLDRTKPYKATDVKAAVRRQNKEGRDLCLRVSANFQTAIQATVLPDRVAIMQIDTPEILLKLPAPLHKKRFGT